MRPLPCPSRLALALLILATLWFAQSSLARQSDPPDDAPAADTADPATAAPPQPWYQRLAQRAWTIRWTDDETEQVMAFELDPSEAPSQEVRRLLSKFSPIIARARRGAQSTPIKYPVDDGSRLTLPSDHLAAARGLCPILWRDLQLRLFDDDSAAVADRLNTILRLANHAAADRSLMGSLVGMAIFQAADKRMDLAIAHGAIGPVEAATLLHALDGVDPEDPYDLREGISAWRDRTIGWLQQNCTGEDGLQHLLDQLGDGAQSNGVASRPDSISHMPPSDLPAAILHCDEAMVRVTACFENPDQKAAADDLISLQARIDAGDFGPIASHLVTDMPRDYRWMTLARTGLKSRLAQLRAIADGTLDPDTLANAAVWYIRAADAMAAVSDSKLAAVRAYALDHRETPDAKLTEILTSSEIQAIIKTIRRAASLERCDFTYISSPPLIHRYHPGMRDLARLLTADTARLLHWHNAGSAGAATAAAQRIAAGYRMCSHLGRDDVVLSALVAHADFSQIASVASAALDGRLLSEDDLAMIRQAMNTFRKGDPFGYQAGLIATRGEVQLHFASVQDRRRRTDAREIEAARLKAATAKRNQPTNPPAAPPTPATTSPDDPASVERTPAQRTAAFVASRDNADIIWLLAIFTAEYPVQSAKMLDRLSLLEDVFDRSAFEEAPAQYEVLLPLIEQARTLELAAIDHEPIVDVDARHKQSRKDLDTAMSRLKTAK